MVFYLKDLVFLLLVQATFHIGFSHVQLDVLVLLVVFLEVSDVLLTVAQPFSQVDHTSVSSVLSPFIFRLVQQFSISCFESSVQRSFCANCSLIGCLYHHTMTMILLLLPAK